MRKIILFKLIHFPDCFKRFNTMINIKNMNFFNKEYNNLRIEVIQVFELFYN